MVTRYSSRNLTKASDKLPALSGLAHEYQMRWPDEYLAGLWQKDLWKNLLWRRDAKYNVPEHGRPTEFQAPTWSWASIDGRIQFPNVLYKSKVRIHSARTQLSGTDPMGEVSSGGIQMRAVVVKMDPYGNIANYLEIQLSNFYDIPDEVVPEKPPRDQWLLWITKTSGLILRRSLRHPMNEMIFERVGCFEAEKDGKLSAFWRTARWKPCVPASNEFVLSSRMTLI
jgi:hypothetical protein